jgi:hypothetical protein
MDQRTYIGMDVHQASISVAVIDSGGKVVMESVIETKAPTILEFIRGVRGTLWVTGAGSTARTPTSAILSVGIIHEANGRRAHTSGAAGTGRRPSGGSLPLRSYRLIFLPK